MSVIVEQVDNEILVRIPSTMDIEFIQSVIDRMKFFEILSRSQATDEDVDRLSKLTKKNWSPEVKARLSQMDEFKDLF
ncbi:hypothetical protein CEQ90_20110 [Lewinellaceae bacterium SD302]|nr:hypothetical protein CEQ90_20110 [Lewinellaceae bacterium SD302]